MTLPGAAGAAERAGISYLALGDSYTIGESIDETGRWPVQLAAALRAEGISLDAPRIIATTGWTTDELDDAIDGAEPLGQYGFVSLLIGVNNQYRGRGVDQYRDQFAALLERAIGFAGGRADRVIVLSIPDWGATRFGRESGRDVARIARELDAYNAAAREVCAQRGVAFVDITPVSRERGVEATMLADDGLHPSAAMYAEWTRLALPAARRMLSP
ncbi:SGNH/GDSL hydrolase family protein [Luteimonas sp. SX5]|uniref:SGNH/GDSL hydrolase family protein n=1 Tax=Luteimonas galliterrae TaxID=2940486 RepID=A0ABT0MLH4_9GAMM|nr:SGNH/GDSL hydrolase family protein [Luteimonas galliterrae]MCL1635739.1 SGNH/GDSL hydrolase family protein [Luteimonas galliterrae]